MQKIKTLILLLIAATSLSSCIASLDNNIEITHLDIVKMNGLSSIILEVEIDNSSRVDLEIQGAEIALKDNGKIIAKGRLKEGVTFESKSRQRHSTQWAISTPSLFGGLGSILNILSGETTRGYTIDYTIDGKAGAYKRTLSKDDIPINSLIK